MKCLGELMLKIEFEESVKETCDCCDGTTTRLTRFVYQDGDAFAVYYAMFSDSHPKREIDVAVGLGEWGEGATPEDRRSFGLVLREAESQYEVTVVDAKESPWHDARFIGHHRSDVR